MRLSLRPLKPLRPVRPVKPVKPGFMPAQQRQRQLVIPVQAGPAAVHAGDKRGPTNITGARPDKLALGGIKVPEQTSQMIEVINRRRWGVGARRITRLAIGKARFLDEIRPGAAAASRGRMRTAGQRMKRVRRARKPRRHVGNISQFSRDYAGRGVGSGTGFGIMGMGHRRDSVLTFCLN